MSISTISSCFQLRRLLRLNAPLSSSLSHYQFVSQQCAEVGRGLVWVEGLHMQHSSPTDDLHSGLFIVDSRRLPLPPLCRRRRRRSPNDAGGWRVQGGQLCPCLPSSFDALLMKQRGRS